MQLFDTWERRKREFVPLQAREVGMYCCGPTVYNYAHIGNLRTYVFEDLLRRALEFDGYLVRHVVNITDVGHLTSDADTGEDKMELSSRRSGQSAWDIAAQYTAAFKSDWRALNLREPTLWCRATDHIEEQVEFIKDIECKGLTYGTADGLYFATALQPGYGFLARLNADKLRGGSRVELGEKRAITDFALWRKSPPGVRRQMEWDSPWGLGCPGWHIECSAMAAKYLGTLFDIHCGGEDHIPVHHTNEIAQAQGRFDTRLANYWLHAAFLQIDAQKMAKSLGGFLRLTSLTERGYDPLAFRYLCLTAHYRGPLNFTWEALDAAVVGLERLRRAFSEWDEGGEPDQISLQRFRESLSDDLNVPGTLATAWAVARGTLPTSVKRATLAKFDEVLGLELASDRAPSSVPESVHVLLAARESARQAKDWSGADAIRMQISALGYEILDGVGGAVVRAKTTPTDSGESESGS